MASIMT